MKGYVWFIAGMAFGEFVLRWAIHAAYLGVIGLLVFKLMH